MDNVVDFSTIRKQVGTGGNPPYDGEMEKRVAKLEALAEKTGERLAALEKDLAIIKSNYATREDVAGLRGDMKTSIAEAKNSIIMWVVGAIFLAQLLPVVAGLVKHFFP